MTVRHGLIVALMSLTGPGNALIAPAGAAAFTCPETSPDGASGPSLPRADLYSGADDITAGNRLGELMATLRSSRLKPALIVDRLIGEYCPLVAADAALSDRQKADRVRRFARLVTGMAYLPADPGEVEVLVQTALSPGLLDQVDEAAGRAGMSRDAWIDRAIRSQLANP